MKARVSKSAREFEKLYESWSDEQRRRYDETRARASEAARAQSAARPYTGPDEHHERVVGGVGAWWMDKD